MLPKVAYISTLYYKITATVTVPVNALASLGDVTKLLSTGDLRILPDLSTFYGRKVGKFTAVNRPIYGNLFTGSRYKKDINFGA
jgi:hypothetical protein